MTEIATPQAAPDPATNPWVPIWNLAPTVALDYLGQWAAGTYVDGNVVIDNGVAYMCVRQTTKRPSPWAPSNTLSNYGTSLPASPYDGQEAVLVDSLTNPAYAWRFRYNAASTSPYKWIFIGGGWLQSADNVSVSTTVLFPGPWVDLGGPKVTAPRSGDYVVSFSSVAGNGTANGGAMINIRSGTNAPGDQTLSYCMCAIVNQYETLSRQGVLTNVVAGEAITVMYLSHIVGTAAFDRRYINVQPLRVA